MYTDKQWPGIHTAVVEIDKQYASPAENDIYSQEMALDVIIAAVEVKTGHNIDTVCSMKVEKLLAELKAEAKDEPDEFCSKCGKGSFSA